MDIPDIPVTGHPFDHSWPVQRLRASLKSGKAEGRIYGPLNRVVSDVFVLHRPHTAQGGWMMKPQPCLRECQANIEPLEAVDELDEFVDEAGGSTDEEDAGSDVDFLDGDDLSNVSAGNTTIDSQRN
ncbi:hypothetical protein FRC07_014441 [Ceratobasidium sp. 392]|nr:hypothetical protein FRC07_014441 [Ceratobasidium sp. 392]